MAWTSMLVCGHSISTASKPAPGSYLTCLSALCQGQRAVASSVEDSEGDR